MRTKSLLTIALAAAGMMYGASVFAADTTPTTGPFGTGKITFTGTITNSPCDIAPGDDAITVSFGQISYRHLKAQGDTSDTKPFSIHLQNCGFDTDTSTPANPVGKMSKVTVSFAANTGGVDVTNKAYISTGSAQHVGVQLLKNDNSTVIEPNTLMPGGDAQQLQTGNNELNFFARVVALAAGVTPGDVNASVTYTLKYL
ncbi:fimbrial protein [Salmonella enterica]|nr:fimbrial protein [Salmonella enterica]EBZ6268102.1 fimbrial protein [Salmonella enterica subsp. enterica serovar Oranienburg]ECA1475344.1 fimbrial protein [Salmonella enterica subsp. enterica serovar Oranienburg]ECA9000636.1 fimbrial protein [Salmonella enterica subsp. enterica serovar Oranienburg]ECA9347492.1 fimbrial protein [Salmonella enterica subsp. enterica serovar Oranienburg]